MKSEDLNDRIPLQYEEREICKQNLKNEENVTDAQVRKLCSYATKNCFIVRQKTQIGMIRTFLLVMDQAGVD